MPIRINNSYILGLALGTPLFFTLSGSIYNGDIFSKEFALPLFLVLLFPYVTISVIVDFKDVIKNTPLVIKFGLIALFYTAANKGGIKLWCLYYLPILCAYVCSYRLRLDFLIRGFLISTFLFASLFVTYSFLTLGVKSSFFLRGADHLFSVFSVYQKVLKALRD